MSHYPMSGAHLDVLRAQPPPEVLGDLRNTFLAVLSIHTYSNSRWLSVASSCRSLVLNLRMGLGSWVQECLGKKTRTWH